MVILSVILILLIFTLLAALLARLAKKQIGFTTRVTIALGLGLVFARSSRLFSGARGR
ncbi:MAG: hypothetical protein LRY35_02580 [Clostridiales bacterium]|nr:hypothetical protein [Clostridiales bacterium]